MKHLTSILAVALAVLPAAAYAQYTGPSALTTTTVKELLANGKDDQHVQLQGRIVKHVGGEDYEFADSTGTIRVEIDHKLWAAGQPVSDKNEVKVTGEFERKWSGRVKVDADHVEVLR
ncbi:YgiW/YdeI family stress tolerance OB fold protein [Burkholderia ambifaria]|uniref:YgiW/YdeI family stress tolerance OB fold protein n=1 Tax=Burkholderia ambifaria TaxID=152480 RepID=UPI00158F2178|nr:NirD/YgiW/YdeI family stress tolerance protein [Burkholderia ambifaria]MBR8183554.1 NirD/YgiW/YdeI family stress tolerance protein [Burkholderia ambifaria]MBR8345801.1 NirD/YgiW/YdeI family stress tolerance protein [Burkholderia ambifaria]UEP37328.1 NirD/YgiW/YdeI family stress tolerance protein [Burkholderia ambifaria]